MVRYDTAVYDLTAGQSIRLRNQSNFFNNVEQYGLLFRVDMIQGTEVGVVLETRATIDPDFKNMSYNELKLTPQASSVQTDKLHIRDIVITNWSAIPAKVNVLLVGD